MVAPPGVPEREHVDGIALSVVLVVEVVSNSDQEESTNVA
jgi:hypothetical protein